MVVGQGKHTAAKRRGTTDGVDQNVQAAETIDGCLDDVIRSLALLASA